MRSPTLLRADSANFEAGPVDVAPKPKPGARKRAAQRKALIDQLIDPIVVVEDAEALQVWGVGTYQQFKPRNAWQDWLVQQAALTTFRINRIQRIERRLRAWESLRAIDFWEEDQALAVENLASKLPKEPGKVVAELLMSPAGCEWLIGRWRGLAKVGPDEWSVEQKTLAHHLSRSEATLITTDQIETRIASLELQRDRTKETDAIARTLAEADLSPHVSTTLAQLRRHERALVARLKWFVAEARFEAPDRPDNPRFRPEYTAPKVEPLGVEASVENEANLIAESDKTNPLSAIEPAAEIGKTNPIEGAEEKLVDPEVVSQKEFSKKTSTTQSDRVEHRKRRIDPARALAKLRKANRRSA